MQPASLLGVAGAYLLGAIPFGYVLYRLRSGRDIRLEGSGNIGATNVMRRAGLAAGLVTLALDFAKGFLAVVGVAWLTSRAPGPMAAAAFAAIVGHIFPVYLRFRGGKGVATALGVFLALAPRSILLALLVFAVAVAIFRYISLGSILAVAAFPLFTLALDSTPWQITAGALASALLIIGRHHSNIARLWAGTERQLALPGLRRS